MSDDVLDQRRDLDRGREVLGDAGSVLVLTGAGISADSGVPTFRGQGGLWKDFRAEDLATPEAFARDPRLVWEWYGLRRQAVLECEPNAAHIAVAEWQLRSDGVYIATQNVDGLHGRALESVLDRSAATDRPLSTNPTDRLLEIHGTLFRVRCVSCGESTAHQDEIDPSSSKTLPHCPACGGLQRPDVVWFGEPLDPDVIERAFGWAETADVCLVIGTSAVVQPAASLASVTRDTGGRIVEINPEPTPLTHMADVSLRGGAAQMVPPLVGQDAR